MVRDVGGVFPDCADHRRDLMLLILLALQVFNYKRSQVFVAEPVSKWPAELIENCGSLLKANCGEVAEWLKAAVC